VLLRQRLDEIMANATADSRAGRRDSDRDLHGRRGGGWVCSSTRCWTSAAGRRPVENSSPKWPQLDEILGPRAFAEARDWCYNAKQACADSAGVI
jgi:hypothetical protein